MNVVGKVGSILSQGVYSVATPFHPFGGAVDIIVVQQQDGTFRSTPWYVRFGKFQGVLKGAEKIVRIKVNGVEANFHMYLDNSGEAYFIKEVISGKEGDVTGVLRDLGSPGGPYKNSSIDYNNKDYSEKNNVNLGRHEDSVSCTGEVELQDDCVIESAESDSERKLYEFQDAQSSLQGSIEFSEYGSNRYENIDDVEQFVDSQNSNSEVVLVSVDGHIITALISSSERNIEDLQLGIPQFHLGPGQGTEFCEGNTEFSMVEELWTADYLGDLHESPLEIASESLYSIDEGGNASGFQLEVCEGEGKLICQAQETKCQDTDFPLGIRENAEDSQENSPHSLLEANETANGIIELGIHDDSSPSSCDPCGSIFPDSQVEVNERVVSDTDHIGSYDISVHSVNNDRELEEQTSVELAVEEVQISEQRPAPKDAHDKSETREPQSTTSSEGVKSDPRTRFELSLCGNLLHAGMGLSAAAEAFDAHRISEENFKLSAESIVKNENLVIRSQDRYLPWDKAAPIVLGVAAYGLHLPVEPKDAIPVGQDNTEPAITSTPSGRRWRLWPIPFRRVKTLDHTSSNLSTEEVFVDSESDLQNQIEPASTSYGTSDSPRKQFKRTNVPTTEQIASLNLKEGQNMVTFNFSTRVLGRQKVEAHIYLWKWNARIVISDVDGTITKSDVLGQFMPFFGKDWTQSGVARLFSAIKENGYQLLFLSARAITQAYLTRSYLLNLKQDGKGLPKGPVLISPDGIFPSLYREVIRRAPHEFKIACLEDIKALFPSDYNPFYAGFGNRDTDELSYRKIGIPKGKIFIINPKGEVAINHRVDLKSYTSLHTLVHDMFPPTGQVEQEEFNSWNYWRMPFPDVDG